MLQRVCYICCNGYTCILQLYVSNVSAISNNIVSVLSCICCTGYTCMLQVYASNVSAIFKRMLQVFYLDVIFVALAIYVCYKCMFQMFQLFQTYVSSVLSGCCICCSDNTLMLREYVLNVSYV
jgi:hypothetical protein